MSSEELEEPWGQLVSVERHGEDEERVPVVGARFLIGRDKGWLDQTELDYPLQLGLLPSQLSY